MQTVEERLLFIWEKVNDWLKYAETKNAGLLVFGGAMIAVLFGFLGSSYKIPANWNKGIFIGLAFFGVSVIISVWSFIPQTRIKYKKFGEPHISDNLFFYGNLCKYKPGKLIDTMLRAYNINDSNALNRSNMDIANQVIVNSAITMNKNKLFKLSTYSLLLGFISIVLTPIVIAYF